jgi:Ion transport protein
MNVIMVLQTMDRFQYTPSDCLACGGHLSNAFDDDGISTRTTTKSSMTTTDAAATALQHNVTCVCPPAPLRWTVTCLDHLIYFFTVEWSLRLLTFTPAPNERTVTVVGRCAQWLGFLTSSSMVLDGLAIFPYYFEILGGTSSNGLMPLRLLRLFRVFQLVRLGQYNASFTALTRVMVQSIVYLKLLVGVLLFCAVFFGSMIYWLERGEWQYWPPTKSWEFVRESIHQGSGIYELSPFTSIPSTFWWFLVTATTVGCKYYSIKHAVVFGFSVGYGSLDVFFLLQLTLCVWSPKIMY